MAGLYGPNGKRLQLSPKHELNPTVSVCFFCHKDKKELVLLGAGYKGEAPHRMIIDRVPCDECKDHMTKGIMLIETPDGASGDNPERTGSLWVITEDAVKRILKGATLEAALQKRVLFIEQKAAVMLGLRPEKAIPDPSPSKDS